MNSSFLFSFLVFIQSVLYNVNRNPGENTNELQQYVNDIKINVFEIAWLTEEQLNFFQSDFKIVAEYFVQMRKNKRYVPSKKEIKHVDAFMKMMKVFAKDSELDEVLTYFTKNNVEVTNMYEGIKVYKQEGIEIGMRQGITKGEEKLSLLIRALKKDNRMDEIIQVTENKELRQELYLEYHIE